MHNEFHSDVEAVSRIPAVPTILEVITRTTGMGFAAVARVTADRWVACSVLDKIQFGLESGGELAIGSTICNEVRQSREPVVIDNVAIDDHWCKHPTPAMYGFQSYISVPIILSDGTFFGTLCAIDPRPAQVSSPEVLGMFRLFAELIGKHLDASRKLAIAESALLEERNVAELREQFIAVLGHDLRTPARSVRSLSELLLKAPLDERAEKVVRLMRDSASRMQNLIEDVLDLARGRLGAGINVNRNSSEPIAPLLRGIIAELTANMPDRTVDDNIRVDREFVHDRSRIGQLFSNLLNNALTYGAAGQAVRVSALTVNGTFELSVANAGEPIPPAALERLFEPFYRNAVRKNREGLGLGLYISHEIAKAHGGTLTATSTHEETRFTFRMPIS